MAGGEAADLTGTACVRHALTARVDQGSMCGKIEPAAAHGLLPAGKSIHQSAADSWTLGPESRPGPPSCLFHESCASGDRLEQRPMPLQTVLEHAACDGNSTPGTCSESSRPAPRCDTSFRNSARVTSISRSLGVLSPPWIRSLPDRLSMACLFRETGQT